VHFTRYKYLERPSHRGLDYVGSWEDRNMGLISFSRLSWLVLEIGVYVSGPVTIEEMKMVMFPPNVYIYSKVIFLVSVILRRF
jgi:hypothetical protein